MSRSKYQNWSDIAPKATDSFHPLESDDDFAEMQATFHISQGFGHFFERKLLVNHRLQPIAFDGVVHLFKHPARANENALHPNGFHQDTSWVELAGTRQDADNRPGTADTHRV